MAKMIPTKEARAEARKCPNGRVYVIDGYGPNDAVPAQAVVGAWQVDATGEIIGRFIPNPHYRPQSGKKE